MITSSSSSLNPEYNFLFPFPHAQRKVQSAPTMSIMPAPQTLPLARVPVNLGLLCLCSEEPSELCIPLHFLNKSFSFCLFIAHTQKPNSQGFRARPSVTRRCGMRGPFGAVKQLCGLSVWLWFCKVIHVFKLKSTHRNIQAYRTITLTVRF